MGCKGTRPAPNPSEGSGSSGSSVLSALEDVTKPADDGEQGERRSIVPPGVRGEPLPQRDRGLEGGALLDGAAAHDPATWGEDGRYPGWRGLRDPPTGFAGPQAGSGELLGREVR